MSDDSRSLPGTWYVVGIAGVGLVLALAILVWRDSSKPFGDALAPASQVFLGAVVAAFGVTQILIGREAMAAARDAVASADAQTAVMREQVAQARQEAEESAQHAKVALELARQERMDADAPIAVLSCDAVSFAEVGRTDQFGNDETNPEDLELTKEDAEARRFRYSGYATLTNFGDRPVHWARSGTHDFGVPHGGLQGLVLPGGSHNFYVDETMTAAQWMATVEAHKSDEPGFRRVEVTIYGARNLVMDTLTVAMFQPPIERDGSRYRIRAHSVQYWPTATVRRSYNPGAL